MMSYNRHPAPSGPIQAQRHRQHDIATYKLNNPTYPFERNERRFPCDKLSPDEMSLDVLNEKAREFRVLLHSPLENDLIPFLQDVPWTTEKPGIVHGLDPSIECTGYFPRCFLCLQHSLSLSLPAAARQKYLQHDHSYTRRHCGGELLLVSQVALGLIERNYVDSFAKMISNVEELTNPARISTRIGECKCDAPDRRSSPVHIEDMERLLSSSWAKFDEVEINSSPTPALPAMALDGQSQFIPKCCDKAPLDEASFIIVTKPRRDNLDSNTTIVAERHCPNRQQAEPSTARVSRDVMSTVLQKVGIVDSSSNVDPAAVGTKCPRENPSSNRATRGLDKALVQRVTRGREIDRRGGDFLMDPAFQPIPNPLLGRRQSKDLTYDELQDGPKQKRICTCDNHALRTEIGLSRSVFRPSATLNLFKPKASCSCCRENQPSLSTFRSPLTPLVEPTARSDQVVPSVCVKSCCPSLERTQGKRSENQPSTQPGRYNELPASNRISAKCPTCGIFFRTFGVVKASSCVMSYISPLARLRDHMTLHESNVLNCVFPSCREMSFDSKDKLGDHMDLHRQVVIVAGVEQWENKNTAPLLLPRFTKPHLTCELCLIDFNWRTTLPGMLSHTERYIKHCDQHRIKMSEDDFCPWQCVLAGCEKKFTSQAVLEEHMWTVHAKLCHCSTCDWIVWGDTDEVYLHREKCTAKLTDVDHKQIGMRSSAKGASKPSTSGSASNKCLGAPSTSPRKVSYHSGLVRRHRAKLLRSRPAKCGKPTPAKLDTASSANHLMRFSFYCEYCGAPFRSHHQKQYLSHVQNHLPDKKLTCVYGDCGRRFGSVQELHSHVKTKLSTCRYCGAVLFLNYKKHILTCRPEHEITKQRLLKEESANVKYAPKEDLYWAGQQLHRSSPGSEHTASVPESDGQECFLRTLNLVKGSFESIKAKTRRQELLRSQIHVANGKGRRACTEKTSCAKCGRIFRNALNLREHLRGYHNARDF